MAPASGRERESGWWRRRRTWSFRADGRPVRIGPARGGEGLGEVAVPGYSDLE